MNLIDLKTTPLPELIEIANDMGLENLARFHTEPLRITDPAR